MEPRLSARYTLPVFTGRVRPVNTGSVYRPKVWFHLVSRPTKADCPVTAFFVLIWCDFAADSPQPSLLLGLTPRLYDWTVSSEHLGFVLVIFITIFCLVPCGRLSWLCQLLGARKYSASYRIVSYYFAFLSVELQAHAARRGGMGP